MTATEDRYAGVRQAMRIISLIGKRPHSRAELAEHLGVHERTVRRLLDAIKEGGVAILQARRDGPTSELEYFFDASENGKVGRRPTNARRNA